MKSLESGCNIVPEKQKLITISIVTDDDTGMYRIGEVDGILQSKQLENYLRTHGERGKTELLEHFAFLQYQVIDAYRNLSLCEGAKQETTMYQRHLYKEKQS